MKKKPIRIIAFYPLFGILYPYLPRYIELTRDVVSEMMNMNLTEAMLNM